MAIPLQYDVFARDRASGTFDRVGASMNRANRQASGFNKSFGMAGAAIGRAAVGATAAVGGLAAAGGFMGLKMAASLQQAQVSFETLLGSAQKAQKFLGQLTAFAARTPFQVQDVVDYSRALLGAGEAARKIVPSLTAWGDASGALGLTQDQFGRTMLAVTQIMNRGKVQGDDLKQITQAGIPVWTLMSRALGQPISALQVMAKNGELLSKDVLPALEAQMGKDYGGAMARQSQTLNGLWSTFTDTLRLGLAKSIMPLVPILQGAMPGAMRAMASGLQSVAGFIAAVIPKVQAFGKHLGDLAGWVTGTLWPAMQAIAADLLPHLQGAFRSISGTIRDNHSVFVGLGQMITQVIIPVVGKVAGILLDVLGPAFKAVVFIIKYVVLPVFAALVAGVLWAVRSLVHMEAKAFGWLPGIGPKLRAADAAVSKFADNVNQHLAGILTDVYVTVHIATSVQTTTHNKGFIGPTMAEGKAAQGIAGPYTEADRGVLGKTVKKAASVANNAGKAIGDSLSSGLASTAPKVSDAGKKLADAAKARFDEIKQAADSLRSSVHDSVMGFFTLQSEGNPFAGLSAMAHKAVAFAAALAKLTRQGVNPAVISMIAQAGPDLGARAAAMLSTAGNKNRARIDNSFGAISAAADRAASTVTNNSFGGQLDIARESRDHLRTIARAVTKGHKPNALSAGWAAT